MKFRQVKKKRKIEVDEMDITSLLDILVILLIFLLTSFNDSDLTVDMAKELVLPYSLSRARTTGGAILQVNAKRNVFVNNELIGSFSNENTFSKIKTVLGKEYKTRMNRIKPVEREKKKDQVINFVFDKTIKFIEMDKVMKATSDVGFSKYKLIIQGDE